MRCKLSLQIFSLCKEDERELWHSHPVPLDKGTTEIKHCGDCSRKLRSNLQFKLERLRHTSAGVECPWAGEPVRLYQSISSMALALSSDTEGAVQGMSADKVPVLSPSPTQSTSLCPKYIDFNLSGLDSLTQQFFTELILAYGLLFGGFEL